MNPNSTRQDELRAEPARQHSSFRGFWSLFVTQFQGAFSDNVYRTLATFLFIQMALSWHVPGDSRELRMAIVGALFSLPFILFSMAGGYLADRYSKRAVSIGTKVAEIIIMGGALVALLLKSPFLLLLTVFLMSAQSAFFGPSKYGLLPELLTEKRLSWGNGVIELGTFLSIIAGTAAGGWLFETFTGSQWWAGIVLIGLATVGTLTSLGISRVPAANPEKKFHPNFVADLWSQLGLVRHDKVLRLAIWGNTYFFFLAALIQQYTIYAYGKDLLGMNEGQITTYLMPAMAVGIGLGSFAAGFLSGKKIEYGLIPLGSLGMTLFGVYLALPNHTRTEVIVGLALYGFFAGFFIVPIAALIQHRPRRGDKGAIIAASNLLSFVGIFLAAGAFFLLAHSLGLNARQVFMVTSTMTCVGTLFALKRMPDAFLRFILWILTHTLYRIRVDGRDNIPAKGGALFVCNHLSQVDAMLLLASTDRNIRFIMFKGIYEQPWIKPFARALRAIPISSELRPREMIRSLQEASDSIRRGEVVCIFAEGQITRIGHTLPFRRGFERIMKDLKAPIIPVALDGVWGSIFSFQKGRFLWKMPRQIPYPVTVNYGRPMPPTATPFEVRQAVQELMAEAWRHRRARMTTLHRAFVRMARHHPFRFAMADAQNSNVRFGAALVRTVFLARRLKAHWSNQKTVGVLLPPSVAGAHVNFAALLMGKVPVNLNYTVSEATLASCIRQCDVKTVVTSKVFLEKVKFKIPCDTVLLEEVVHPPGSTAPSWSERLSAAVMAFVLPAGLLERALGRGPRIGLDDLATVIFSSGSTGDPKGVMLSHYNIGSNIEQMEQVFGLGPHDKVFGVLPFFHSFGFTGTLCLPAVLGVGAVYHANPLDAKTIGQLVGQFSATFLLATPTFLQLYLRGCSAEDFGSLRLVMTGAEKLSDRLAAAFEEQFGLRPLEGYGCTECAPAVAVNTYDFRSAGFRQVGAKRGKIGHPLPGVSVRIVDPQTFQPAPLGQPGLLLVHGPNVMQGYLGKPDKTAEVLLDESALPSETISKLAPASHPPERHSIRWYVTGDIAAVDADGFLQITDRLSRFSKIGGEMVPHIKVEEKLHELAGATEQTFVVAGVPDEKKGERLIVLHTLAHDRLQPCLEKLAQSDLPNLWKPRPDQFFRVDAFPYLGTGKLDLRKVKELADQLARGASAAA